MDTWYNSVDKTKAEVVFFANASSENVKIVKLPGVSDFDYPPQKKSFRALQFVLKHHPEIHWYLRADDDIVINWANLEVFLNQLDHERTLLIGAPGFGKHEEDFIEEGFAFCMGGPGVLMSKGLLDKIRGRLNLCQNTIWKELQTTLFKAQLSFLFRIQKNDQKIDQKLAEIGQN